MKRNFGTLAGLAMALILVSACGTGGGIGDILGGGSQQQPQSNYGTLRGTVDSVDINNRSIVLTNVSGYNNMLSNSGSSGSTVRVYFDNQTSIQYQGQGYRPEDLERGDDVEVRVNESSNQLVAETVTVVRDASPGSTSSGSNYPNDAYGSTITGTVRYVDASRRTIELDRGYGNGTMVVEFDDRTPVAFSGRTYRASDLERGDEIEVRITNLGTNRYRADNITVLRSVSGGTNSSNSGTYGTANSGTVRGTVRYVDTTRRTIELESTTGISGFNTGAGTSLVIQYGSNAVVEVNGRGQDITGLERGDVIEARVDRSGSTWFADRIILVRDVNSR
jgi:hypothetical protein